ncbi:MAG: D-alanyl-D-alanine carboxypeptidase [Proteobacteria bacterium]|nr:D-alanyl-D-alanine carboxypeptidase [Pseudomonadota bacterium]
MLLRIDRLRVLALFLALAGLAGPVVDAYAQTEQPRRQQNQQKPRPPAKPATAPKGPKAAAAEQAAKLEAAGPSQIGTTTVARFACMIDADTGTVILAKDAEKPMAPSSMAKMMTVYLLFEDLTSGKLKPDTRFSVSERAYAITRGTHSSTMFLEPTDQPTVNELIQGIIVDSGNDASVAVAEGMAGSEEAFAERMNKRAKEIGLTGSVFKNSSGWPAEGQRVTARDLAVLALRTVHDFPQLYKHYAQRDFTFNGKTQPNRNLELKTVAGVDGLKTGHTEEGGFGQTTSAIRDGRRLILVLNGMSSIAERAQETARLIEWGFRESSNKTILKAGDTVAEAPVWLGEKEKVPLVIPQSVMVTSMVGQTAQPRIVARFDGPVAAPIAKGAKLGTAVVTMPDNRTIEYPLLAGEAVERAGVVSRVSTLIRHYLLGWAS